MIYDLELVQKVNNTIEAPKNCKSCGKVFESYMRANAKYCSVSCRTKSQSKYIKKPAIRTKESEFKRYLNSAKLRGIGFELTQKEFDIFWNQNCFYCDSNISAVGIDRYDSSLGYTLLNCVPCCTRCNLMKRKMHGDDFIKVCNIIASKLNKLQK